MDKMGWVSKLLVDLLFGQLMFLFYKYDYCFHILHDIFILNKLIDNKRLIYSQTDAV